MAAGLIHSARSAWIGSGLMAGVAAFLACNPLYAENASRPVAAQGSAVDADTVAAFQHAIAAQLMLPAGLNDAGEVRLRLHLRLNRDGSFAGEPAVDASGGSEQTQSVLKNAAMRAIKRAAPFTMFPKDNYEAWKEVTVNFDTSQLNP